MKTAPGMTVQTTYRPNVSTIAQIIECNVQSSFKGASKENKSVRHKLDLRVPYACYVALLILTQDI